eukprot:CAMPEP_0202918956 /NCGR_PEP_ID=MMETSP1392-20130828/74628_1 /ASSEMBLY_ACC=CAM_ASM_000868 /TAXON_ID=225041 /ORGANISM="Chlamydomonas chlamydogama, Strain SAG 11-48b" /LENGTH=38 /DNA_ID= /DNA_START= /DNA_END= /DNA_ORIENTATION=
MPACAPAWCPMPPYPASSTMYGTSFSGLPGLDSGEGSA